MPLHPPTSGAMPAPHGWPIVGATSTDGWLSTGRSVSASIWATSSPHVPSCCLFCYYASYVHIFAGNTSPSCQEPLPEDYWFLEKWVWGGPFKVLCPWDAALCTLTIWRCSMTAHHSSSSTTRWPSTTPRQPSTTSLSTPLPPTFKQALRGCLCAPPLRQGRPAQDWDRRSDADALCNNIYKASEDLTWDLFFFPVPSTTLSMSPHY